MTHRRAALLILAILAASASTSSPAQAAFPGANGLLVFDTSGGSTLPVGNIYTVKPDGSDLVQLTSDGQSVDPAWSPNGTRIAYSRHGFIFVMTAHGTQARKVSRIWPSRQPAWSPNGKRIAFTHNGDIWLVRADGGHPVQLTHDAANCGGDSQPTWSPLGGTIAFTGSCHQIVVLRLKTGARHLIPDASSPDFTADGHGLVYASDDDLEGGFLPGPQFESSDLRGGLRAMYSRDFCAEGAPCLAGDVAAAPTSSLASPQGVYVETFEGGGFCVSAAAGADVGFCQFGSVPTIPFPSHIDWQPRP